MSMRQVVGLTTVLALAAFAAPVTTARACDHGRGCYTYYYPPKYSGYYYSGYGHCGSKKILVLPPKGGFVGQPGFPGQGPVGPGAPVGGAPGVVGGPNGVVPGNPGPGPGTPVPGAPAAGVPAPGGPAPGGPVQGVPVQGGARPGPQPEADPIGNAPPAGNPAPGGNPGVGQRPVDDDVLPQAQRRVLGRAGAR